MGLNHLYDMVLNGEWTIERMREYASLAYMDMDGNGVMDAADRYGAVSLKNGRVNLFLRTSGISLVTYDESRDRMRVEVSDGAMDLMQQIGALWLEDGGTYLASSDSELYSAITEDRTLFAVDTLRRNNGALVSMLRESDCSMYGVLPMPKTDMEQEKYLSSTDTVYNVIAIIDDCEAVGVTLDTMSSYNRENLLDVYQESLMRGLADSPEAREVLNLIFEGMTWDYLAVYDGALGNATNVLWTSAFTSGMPNSLMSTIRGNQAMVNRQLEELEVRILKK